MSSTDPESVARLLRSRAASEPLRIEVAGSSMGRTIVSGSVVWVTAAPRPRWGEIWAFCDPDANVAVHRCVGRRDGRIRFWGDGNATADALAPVEVLIGRVVAMQTPGGHHRRTNVVTQLAWASYVGARRFPGRVWNSRGKLMRRIRR